jgi:hypothetical protein
MQATLWLARVGEWTGPEPVYRRIGIACEMVRGIVEVTDLEWPLAVDWAGGKPTLSDWIRALELYGPVLTPAEREHRAGIIIAAVDLGDRITVRAAIR